MHLATMLYCGIDLNYEVDNDPMLELRRSSLRLNPGDVSQVKLLRGAGLQRMYYKRQMITYDMKK
jgi:hypothetical protein